MARKVDPAPAAPATDQVAGELAQLAPDLTVEIAGREVKVREYRVFEGLEVAAQAAPLIADVVDVCRTGEFTYERARPLLGRHLALTAELVARATEDAATGEPVGVQWIEGLQRREDLETLLSIWFGVNAGFFVHEAIVVLRQERLRAAMAQAGSTSSPGSPKAGSATTSASGD